MSRQLRADRAWRLARSDDCGCRDESGDRYPEPATARRPCRESSNAQLQQRARLAHGDGSKRQMGATLAYPEQQLTVVEWTMTGFHDPSVTIHFDGVPQSPHEPP